MNEEVREVKLRDGRTVIVRGPITRIPEGETTYDSLILPNDHRTARIVEDVTDGEETPSQIEARAELGVLFEAVSNRLSGVERLVLALSLEGYSPEEIAPKIAGERPYLRAGEKEGTYGKGTVVNIRSRAIRKIRAVAGVPEKAPIPRLFDKVGNDRLAYWKGRKKGRHD